MLSWRSRARRARSMLSRIAAESTVGAAGTGAGGGAFLEHAAITAVASAKVMTATRRWETMSDPLRFWWRKGKLKLLTDGQPGRPCPVLSAGLVSELSGHTGPGIQYPELVRPTAVRGENDMPAIRPPRGAL